MRKLIKSAAIISLIVLVLFSVGSCGFNDDSSFKITFINVGQGDSALVECDKQYMLIDGGPEFASKEVQQVLVDNEVQRLSILAISHLHEDHIGGLIKALPYVRKIDKTISNKDNFNSNTFNKLEEELKRLDTKIEVPNQGDKFNLGSAEIEVVDASSNTDNDSLVLLITYQNNTFLFTGDMPQSQEDIIIENTNHNYPVTLLKVSHHGAGGDNGSKETDYNSYEFIRTTSPQYAIISVGEDNQYGHPTEQTISRLEQASVKTYRTDYDGTITVESNGKKLKITTEK